MDSPSSVSSYSSSSLSPSFSTSPVNSDFSFPSDKEREGRDAHGLKSDAVQRRGGSRPSPGPIRCRHRPRVSSNQHTAFHPEQRGSGVKRARDCEVEPSPDTRACTTEGDLLFAQKCEELQGFIRPLTDLLNGLKMGRFDRGLSSFQQSVAMDRIQRIVGVLRKPRMGERYLGTLLQVEGMLKTWFPHIAAQKTSLGSGGHQPHKHIPSSHSDLPVSCPLVEKMGQTQLGHLVLKPKASWHLTEWPAVNLTWIHSTPVSNPPLSSTGSAATSDSHSPTGASIGVILVLQKGGQPFTHSAPGTPVPPTSTLSPVIPGDLKKVSREAPRCHSLPVMLPSDWSRSLCPCVVPVTGREKTRGHMEPQMISHSPVAPDP
ncbi:circadian-associated transcriptional repressor [Acomys russatus]|uniref:circadian-associated transcriptional repressor n=1 Tax=Acomys russatus TaxID=60746 RepID=UPI0021E21094|nr:circadian-associated transcriptional repressor [Acomys russatus]